MGRPKGPSNGSREAGTSKSDSGRPLVVGSHDRERCVDVGSDGLWGEEFGISRSAPEITNTSVNIMSVAGGLCPTRPWTANPYISLAAGLQNPSLLPIRQREQNRHSDAVTFPIVYHTTA